MLSRDQAAELFMQELASEVFEKSIWTVFRRLEQSPRVLEADNSEVQHLQSLHQWFLSLSESDKHNVRSTVVDTAWSALHSLCYFFDSGAFLELEADNEIVFAVSLQAYVTESDWLAHHAPAWSVRISPALHGWDLQDAEWEYVVSVARQNHWESYLGIDTEPSLPVKIPPLTQLFRVGSYHELRRIARRTCLEAQLVPHGYAAKQVIPNYHYETAPAILVPADMHYDMHRSNPLFTSRLQNEENPLILDRDGAATLFLETLRKEIFEKSVQEVTEILMYGASWNPPADSADPVDRRAYELHRWFINMPERDKQTVLTLVMYTVEIFLHGLCYLLDGGVHISCEHAEEVEFAVYLELYERVFGLSNSDRLIWSVRICPMKGEGWDLHEAVGMF